MAFPRECYDAKTLDFMTHVLESAWRDVEHLIHGRKLDYTALRTVMSVRIMAGVRDGDCPMQRKLLGDAVRALAGGSAGLQPRR